MAALRIADADIIFLPCGFFFFFFLLFFFPRLISAVGDWMSTFHTWGGFSANLGCRSKTAARGSLEMQDPKKYLKRQIGIL